MNKYEGTEFTTEDFVALDTLDNVERNVVLALEEHRLGIPQLPFLDDVKISRGKDCKGTLTKIFICSKFCCSFEKEKYFERHSGVCHHQKEKEVKPKKGELAIYPTPYIIIRILDHIYHFNLLICYPCSFYFHALMLVGPSEQNLSLFNNTWKD